MIDSNGSRFALILGLHDWGRCRLDTDGTPRLAALWADENRVAATPLVYDEAQASIALARRVGRFRAGRGDLAPDPARRLGAATDRSGNVYAIVDGGRRIDVRSAGSGIVSLFWPVAPAEAPVEAGEFAPAEAAERRPPQILRGLAVTTGQYLVAGLVPDSSRTGDPGGLLVFDLLAGGPPLQLAWPAPWTLVPQDMAPRANGGLAVLDRTHGRVWLLDRRLGMEATFPVAPEPGGDFTPADGSTPALSPSAAQPWFDLQSTAKGGGDPVALEVLHDDAIVVLDAAGTDGFALIGLYEAGGLAAQASTKVVLAVIAPEDRADFELRGFDFGLHTLRFVADGAERQRLIVVSHEGNQALAFDLVRGPGALTLVPDAGFLPMKRYGGLSVVATGRAAVDGDTGLLYDSGGGWLPLVLQRRPRYQPVGALITEPFDGQDPGCTWHRLMLDGCIPPGCLVRVGSRCADEPALLAGMSFEDEPLPLLRPDGSELPWLIEGPGSHTDAAMGHGTWELLFQRARGRWLQLRLSLEGNELATPRLAALRAWRPRFSYSQRYLPAVYREDAVSADFLERFLANFEGQFTTLEERIAAASALFDVRSAPADTLDWLAGWLGLVLDPSLDEPRRRQLIRNAVPMYQYRGTTAALRLAVQLALSRCVPEEDFALPAPSQVQPWGVRLVEGFLTRSLPPALLGETTFEDAPRLVTPGARWTVAEGAAGLHRRWRTWLAAAGKPDDAALFRPLPPAGEALRSDWQSFSAATLGAVPQLAELFDAAWKSFAVNGRDAGLGAEVPLRWPHDNDAQAEARRQAWRDFIAGLAGPLRRWVRRWQGFLARRHLRPDALKRDTGVDWPEFELVPVPTVLPTQDAALADWTLFETRVEPMAASAHSFSVLLPIAGPQAEAVALAQQIDLAQRVVRLAKPAHTRFDVRPYWALFRLGQVRLGLDTLLGEGAREPGLAPPLVLGQAHLGAARVAPRSYVPADRMLLEC